MLEQATTSQFRKDYKLAIKRGLNLGKLKAIMRKLTEQCPLDSKCKDHKLSGNYQNHRECHIEPDWLLIYRITDTMILFVRTGSHSDLFKK